MGWECITNIASIVTCIAFILYLVGHIWSIGVSKNKIFEKFEFENEDLELSPNEYFDFAGEYGQLFSVSSPEGIREVKFYSIDVDGVKDGLIKPDKMLKRIKKIKPNQKVYARAELHDTGSNLYLEIKRNDYIKISFMVADSGKDGSFVMNNYKEKMTFLSWLYYLCV